ncbi:MAG TPA: hypothetical protein PLL77_06085 [Pyrinomonadaceae bacterium]|nr:hypothetical protein [Pyrinomonadaceae bacterium]
MKCKYKFPAKASVTFPTGLKFIHNTRTYELETLDERLTHLSVTVEDFPDQYLPTITPLRDQLAQAEIKIPPDPFRDDIIGEVRSIEGGLCLWGLDEIDIDSMQIEWIPDTPEDTAKLQLTAFTACERSRSERTRGPAPLDLYVRTILIRDKLADIETPLNFYRRGRLDLGERRYIDAIYDFYFVLENLFANGKFKSSQVIAEFCKSEELTVAFDYLKAAEDHREHFPAESMDEYKERFLHKTNPEIAKYLVETRGFLHHHTARKSGTWHPARQREYRLDAIIFANVCTQILMGRTNPLLFENKLFSEFRELEIRASDGQPLSWDFSRHNMSD